MVKKVGREHLRLQRERGRDRKGGRRGKEREGTNLYRYFPCLRSRRRNIAVSETRAEFRMGPCTSSQWKVSAFDPPSSVLLEASRIVES